MCRTNKDKLKILMCADNLLIQGISIVIMNYIRNIDKKRFEVTLAVGNQVNEEYINECQKLGIKVTLLPIRHVNPIRFYLALFKFIRNNSFDIFHMHGNSSIMSIGLFISLILGVKIRIAHCHSSQSEHEKIHKLLLPFFKHTYTHAFACSEISGKWIFGEGNFTVIPNGLNINQFIFNQKSRELIRNKLLLSKKYVLCNVGRMELKKNVHYLIKVFTQVAEKMDDAVLLLIGDGCDIERLRSIAHKSNYENRIIFYGEAKNIPEILSAADIFLSASPAEGFGLVAVEAQLSGLYCILSNSFPKEVTVTQNTITLPIGEHDVMKWTNEIIKKIQVSNRNAVYNQNSDLICKYDIKSTIKVLENKYLEFVQVINKKEIS